MGKHSAGNEDQPRTGNGWTGGKKPKSLQVSQTTSSGTIIWSQTAKLWARFKGNA